MRLRASAFAALMGTGVLSALPATSAAAPVRYAVDQRVCPPVTHFGEFTCFAIRHVPATAATPGAKVEPADVLPSWARGPAGGLTPRALASAYRYNPWMGGSKQTVAIVDWYDDPNVVADLNHFNHQYGRPTETATSFRKVNENGKTSPLPKPDKNSTVEISLDVQAVRAVCPRCKILLVEASAPQAENLARAENTAARMGATVISNSFGTPEHRGHPFPEWLRLAFDHHKVVTTASTGDDGWYGWDVVNAGVHPATTPTFPATSPKVVAVGGTRLNLNANGHRTTEPAWNDNGPDNSVGRNRHAPMGATGSGCSVLFDAPSWQKAAPNYALSGCKGKRFTADVAAVAAPATGLDIYDSYGAPGWIRVGGTSLSAPLIAGMFAIIGGSLGVDFPAQTLYTNRRLHPSYEYDVGAGGSSWCGGDNIDNCSKAVHHLDTWTKNPNVWESTRVDCSYPLHGERHSDAPRNLSCNAAHGLDGPTGVGTPAKIRMFRLP